MKSFLFFLFTALVIANIDAATRQHWTRYVIFPEGADYEVESRSKESFILKAKRTDEKVVKTGALAIANINREMWTHNRFTMMVRSLNGKRVGVAVTLSHPNGSGKTVMTTPPGINISGRSWRKIVLGLDTDFSLGDRNILIQQVKIGAWISSWKSGEEGGIEVKDLRLCGPSEVQSSAIWQPNDTFVSVPAKQFSPPKAKPESLKVFFAFDNEDVVDSIHVRKHFSDRQQSAGFRGTLLEKLDGFATCTTNLQEANVIVYSRCAPAPQEAKEIARAVTERGIPLYAASEIGDPEIEAILPCQLSHDAPEDLPNRAPIQSSVASHPLASPQDFNRAAFGIYRNIRSLPQATTILSFTNGIPALVEGFAGKGKVLYNMLAIGSSLVPHKESYDAFFVRAIGYLTGRNLPERPQETIHPDKNGWWNGIGADSFGRFGWEVGSGLLVGSVGSRLNVVNGEASYEFNVPRKDAQPRKVTFAGDRAESLSLGGEVCINGAKAYRVDISLAYPGVRWQIRTNEIELHLANLNAFAYLPTGKTIDLSLASSIDINELTKPYILLYNGSERDSPLLLVLQHRPAKIDVIRNGEAFAALRFTSSSTSVGSIIPTWLFGSVPVNTTQWQGTISKEVLSRISEWYPRAFSYPIRSREKFRLDESVKRIEIRSRYGFARTIDDWQTPQAQYAAIPPVAWNLVNVKPAVGSRGIVETEASVKASGLLTTIGELAFKEGSNSVQWSLPLFKSDLSLLPHSIGRDDLEKIANDQFSSGVRFTCGGGVRVDYRKDKCGRDKVRSLNMHGETMGLCRASPNPFIYSEENRRLLRRRMTWRLLEPLESMTFKMVTRWRREPVSGIKYTIYMNSPRDITTIYEPDTYGSKIIYGDSNETVRMILSCVKVLEDRMGQEGLVSANWDTISRHVASYELALDDWGIMASGCLEWGGPGCIDMLNSEFGCLMTLARLAEIKGDEAMRAQALYRASRRMCPTLARLKMLAYQTRSGMLDRADRFRAATGFNENGPSFQARGRRVQDIDFFDMSQGIPQDLISLYRWYGWGELRADYLSEVAKATCAEGINYITAATLALDGKTSETLIADKLALAQADTRLNKWLPTDWPGMDTGSYLEYILHRLYKSPVITDCRGVYLHNAVWNHETKRLTLDFTPGENARLAVNGKAIQLNSKGKRQTLHWSESCSLR